MLGRWLMAGLAASLAGCAPPTSVKDAFAECQAQQQKAEAAVGSDADVLSACMQARGFEVMSGYCSVTAAPDRREGCYRRIAR